MASLPKSLARPKPSSGKSSAASAPMLPGEKCIAASKAKAQLLELLHTVDRKQESVIITRRGRPVARLIPIEPRRPSDIFGCMKGTFRITGDVVGPEPDVWEAMS